MRYEPIFEVGDVVIITNPDECRYGCSDEMRRLVGQETVVESRRIDFHKNYEYRLRIDNGMWTWCDRSVRLVEEKDILESDEDISILIS